MFQHIGSTIKSLGKIILCLGILASIVTGIGLLMADILWGPLIIVVGGFSSLAISFLIYGFGQLIENTDILVANCRNTASKSRTQR